MISAFGARHDVLHCRDDFSSSVGICIVHLHLCTDAFAFALGGREEKISRSLTSTWLCRAACRDLSKATSSFYAETRTVEKLGAISRTFSVYLNVKPQ